jgi:hypothetical protein
VDILGVTGVRIRKDNDMNWGGYFGTKTHTAVSLLQDLLFENSSLKYRSNQQLNTQTTQQQISTS